MIVLKFLDQNVFNVIKYVFMTITVSYASDVLLDALHSYRTAKSLKDRGWAKPVSSAPYFRLRRNLRFTRSTGSAIVIISAIVVTVLEMSVEFSTGAEIVWIEKSTRLRVANQVSSLDALLKTDPRYIFRLRGALQRVENTCYSVERKWYHPVVVNMSSATDFQALGHVAKCFQNYTTPIDATPLITEAMFNASEFTSMGYWPMNETRMGRDVDYAEVMSTLDAKKDVSIGANEYYSFLAVNFTRPKKVEGTERPITGNVTYVVTTESLITLNYTVPSGEQIECLVKCKERKQKKKYILEACLLPLSKNRTVVGLFDDYEDTPDYQLVMSVALEGRRSFHDLGILKAMPWMIGTNIGTHSYREVAILVALCGGMLEGIGSDGFRDVDVVEGIRNTTAPTLTVWGVLLLSVGTVIIVVGSLVLRRLKSNLAIRGDLATAEGVASHWLAQMNEVYDSSRVEEKAILSVEYGMKDRSYITVRRVGNKVDAEIVR
ncbi:hypothetical protein BWQ96_00522 [Gracilariopsis chorda]|uniref:Uncharacterized protein n=1 Tax=Gracilariopsis chorda TaxID=448386 RepID=A0A2V3J5I6_9FLOR|nr:hypothetical protein BWQ96_00522 [Gracilariopsis chorda]|eukprot:PXF49644.1 hypothetical protein BWQ96_00522 [Gracilariopsis chorda]